MQIPSTHPKSPHLYNPLCYIKITLLPALALIVRTCHELWVVESSIVNHCKSRSYVNSCVLQSITSDEACRDVDTINCLDIFGYVRMEMNNCLFNTFNYFCNMIVRNVICSFLGCHGERNIPCCVSTLCHNFFQHYNILWE